MVLIRFGQSRVDMLLHLEEHGPTPSGELKSAVKLCDREALFYSDIKDMLDADYIKRKSVGGDKRKRVYSITPTGRMALRLHRKPKANETTS